MGFSLLINAVYWGYNPFTNHLLILLGHPNTPETHFFPLTMGGPLEFWSFRTWNFPAFLGANCYGSDIYDLHLGCLFHGKLIGKYAIVPWILWNSHGSYEIPMDPMKFPWILWNSHGSYEIPWILWNWMLKLKMIEHNFVNLFFSDELKKTWGN